MNVGESVTVPIRARLWWNRTGIVLQPGAEYHFEASGIWYDWGIRCSADGYSSPSWLHSISERFRRVPGENWFTLIGALGGQRRTLFRIGRYGTQRPDSAGELCCFANDVPGMFWNNRGEIALRVSRTA